MAETTINFTQKLQDAGLSGTFDDAHLRVLEVDADGFVIDYETPFQFDRDPDYQAASNASGKLVLLLQGQLAPFQTRRFFAYFDTVENSNDKTPAQVITRVSYQDDVAYEGQLSYAITTSNATYYYHKRGSGFASMVDSGANDWIGYRPSGGSAGDYRGVPNLATYRRGATVALFHPGEVKAYSTILNSGPLKLTIKSQTDANDWAKIWEIYPYYATMTLLLKPDDKQYWILYEGTPGGRISEGDYYVLPDGVRRDIDTVLETDLPGEEWIYFGDDEKQAVLYVINHQEDEALDCHYVLQGNMTVFGFGRDRNAVNSKLLNALPGSFTYGFTPTGDHATVQEKIRAAYKPLAVTVGNGEHP